MLRSARNDVQPKFLSFGGARGGLNRNKITIQDHPHFLHDENKIISGRKFIFSLTKKYFLPNENKFTSGRKFISSLMKKYFLPDENLRASRRKLIPIKGEVVQRHCEGDSPKQSRKTPLNPPSGGKRTQIITLRPYIPRLFPLRGLGGYTGLLCSARNDGRVESKIVNRKSKI